ncbi:MAG: ParB/RepB/Spo0J family partition protein [Tagaea sp.]|nr:ParB/RepB/Spo0J family partition protein [Tagaea sp.]
MPDGTAAPAASVKQLTFAQIERSTLNPRKRFDDEAIGRLADSIDQLGLLQNMTVRPHPKAAGKFELIAGEQRHRAIEKLIASKRKPAEATWPVSVVEIDDKTALTVALTENVARSELTPWEEADAFKRLVDMKMLPREIGARIGKTERFVQLRLRLLDKLAPKAFEALKAGKISLEHARELLKAPAKRQEETLKRIVPLDAKEEPRGYNLLRTALQVREALREGLTAIGEALFDPATYKGEIVTDEDTGEKFFADAGEFNRKQTQAIEAKVAELKAKHGRAEFSDRSQDATLPYDWRQATKAQIAAGGTTCLVWIDNSKLPWRFVVQTHCVPEEGFQPNGGRAAKPGTAKTESKAPEPKAEDVLAGAARQALTVRTHALQTAIAADANHAKRAVVFALLGQSAVVRLSYRNIKILSEGKGEPAPAVAAILAGYAKRGLKGAESYTRTDTRWKEIAALNAADLDKLFAALVASCVSVDDRYASDCWPEADELAIAATVKADPAATFKLDAEFLSKLKKPQLLRIAADLRLEDDPRLARGAELTGTVIRGVILGQGDKLKGYVPPWCRFQPGADMKAQLRVAPKFTGGTKGAPTTAPASKPAPKAAAKPKAKPAAKAKPKAKGK